MFNFNHVALSVDNVEKSLEFYKKLGFKILKEYHDKSVDIFHLSLNDVVLEIFHYFDNIDLPEHSKNLPTDLKTIGNKHFGLGVKDIMKAREFVKNEKLFDGDIDIIQGRLGKPYFFIKDPDGILIEIIEE